ncbi:MAG: Ig-like domain-containing protein [Flavobacteriaceae bacterium]|nr:Ig-like domain-containing protein [Flavobacteriaceae bacterium]
MTFKYYNEEGKEEALERPRWDSSASKVADVDRANGLVTALKAGTTVITVRTREPDAALRVTDTYEITVSDP